MQKLHCGDLNEGCEHVVHGETAEDIIKQAAAHVHDDHGVTEITPEIEAALRAAIRPAA